MNLSITNQWSEGGELFGAVLAWRKSGANQRGQPLQIFDVINHFSRCQHIVQQHKRAYQFTNSKNVESSISVT